MRLTKEEWARIRQTWELDSRRSFPWLISELNLSVTAKAIRLRAQKEGWSKRRKKGLQAVISPPAEPKEPKKEEKELREDIERAFSGIDLEEKEAKFCIEYLKDFNGTRAAKAAGYAFPEKHCSAILRQPNVSNAVKNFIVCRAARSGMSGDELIKIWIGILGFDANEFGSYVRFCCPFCYSTNNEPQESLADYYKLKDKWDTRQMEKSAKDPDYDPVDFRPMREIWDKSLPPIKTCPNCAGVGYGQVVIRDTRKLSPIAQLIYSGVAETKGGGVEIIAMSKQIAMDNLAKALGLFRGQEKVAEINIINNAELNERYEEILRKARERQRKVMQEREQVIEGELIDGD